MKKYIIANWKALPNTWAQAEGILDFLSEHIAQVPESALTVLCPPFVYIEDVAKVLDTSSLKNRIELGAQDIAAGDEPGQTGEVTAEMIVRCGGRYVIIGHSERRYKIGESDAVTNKKLKTALAHDLTPIVCIGERTREGDYKKFIIDQIEATFAGLSADQIEKCFIAYEPVWAISTNPGAQPDSPASSRESVTMIRDYLSLKFKVTSLKFLYGGSINEKNAKDFLSIPEFSGVLVGGASVRKEEFVEILKSV